jgi:hypothetical protein
MQAGVFLPLSIILALIVLFQFSRANRVAGGVGWVLFIFAVGAFGSGVATAITWGGLIFGSIGGLGVIIVIQEEFFRRHDRRRHRQGSASASLRRRK